jgi:2-keto-3-deoxy-L-rhamnonate aldolase RhmA
MAKFTKISKKRRELKAKFRNRELIFAAWVSYPTPSIVETFADAPFDVMCIDMEHSTISLEQAQRIIAASQSFDTPCIPRPVSHSNDYIKPLLESGADGILLQMAETSDEVKTFLDNVKYPPLGKRTYGINRGQSYGLDSDAYFKTWNDDSIALLQIESRLGVANIDSLLSFDEIDGVMIGPYDLSGSLGVAGQLDHPLVIEASQKVIESCKAHGKSCGFQIATVTPEAVKFHIDLGFNFVILASDLFILRDWSQSMSKLTAAFRKV